jgi:Fe-S-cluster containining protein
MNVRVPANARWDCHSCGACCRLYELGPVEPSVIAGLEASKIETLWEPASRGPWYTNRQGPDGNYAAFLAHVDGHCVFLRDDNKCAVHGLLGAAAKPAFCREFPFHTVEDPRGLAVIVRPTCEGFSASSADGATYEAHLDEVLALPRVTPRRRFAPAEVPVLLDRAVPIHAWMDVEDALLAALDGRADADPLVPIALARELLANRLGFPCPSPDPKRARMAAGAVIEGIRRILAVAAEDPNADPHRRAFVVAARDAMATALPRLDRAAPLAPDAAAWWNLLVRSAILGKSWTSQGAVAAGIGTLGVQAMLIRALAPALRSADASLRAPLAHADPITSADAGPIVVKWAKIIDNQAVAGLMRKAAPALLDVFYHAGNSA